MLQQRDFVLSVSYKIDIIQKTICLYLGRTFKRKTAFAFVSLRSESQNLSTFFFQGRGMVGSVLRCFAAEGSTAGDPYLPISMLEQVPGFPGAKASTMGTGTTGTKHHCSFAKRQALEWGFPGSSVG